MRTTHVDAFVFEFLSTMFWGLKLENGKRYSQLVEKPFHISHAALALVHTNNGGPLFPQDLIGIHAIVEKTDYIICYLDASRGIIQQSLDLKVSEGEEITLYFEVVTDCPVTVFLTGYFVEEPGFPQSLEDFTNDEYSLSDLDLSEEGESEDGDNEQGALASLLFSGELSSDESDEDYVEHLRKKSSLTLPSPPAIEENAICRNHKEAAISGGGSNLEKKRSRKRKREELVKQLVKETQPDEMEHPPKKKKKEKKRKRLRSEGSELDVTAQQQSSRSSKPKKAIHAATHIQKKNSVRKLKGGTEVEEIEIGTGNVAKPGKKVFVRYTGCLAHNGQVFDSNTRGSGKPFMFRLGQGEVIRGWDEGITGMQVGGKRRLSVPPKQGYGVAGALPKIPPNSKLIFEVELVNVK